VALSPAEYVIRVFGGVRKTARAVGRSPASVSKWRAKKKNNGSGGRIPTAAAERILSIAKETGLDITPFDLLCGRKVDRKTDRRIKVG